MYNVGAKYKKTQKTDTSPNNTLYRSFYQNSRISDLIALSTLKYTIFIASISSVRTVVTHHTRKL